jgi:hypothetical protein
MAKACIQGWAAAQDFPRDAFEIILAVPEGHPVQDVEEVQALLSRWDRVLTFSVRHDMDLVAETARHARGEFLVFTEAHCIPQPDFLSAAWKAMEDHPEWAGFSGSSRPITHNLLSEVEAAMYMCAIRRNLEEHPWLKILDQCLVIRQAAYIQCGGIDPEYGHFAEWLLGARLHQQGLVMGHEPAAAVSHYYIGEFEDIMTFTEDFACGHMRFEMAGQGDPCAGMFDSTAYWEDRAGLDRRIARLMVSLVWRARKGLHGQKARAQWRSRLRMWLRRAVGGAAQEWRSACRHTEEMRRETERNLQNGDRDGAQSSFLELILACGAKGHLSALRKAPGTGWRDLLRTIPQSKRSGRWFPGAPAAVVQAGFFSRGTFRGQHFCWTQPEAMVWLPLRRGCYRVRIRWIEFAQLRGHGRYRFYHDEREIPAAHMMDVDKGVEITLDVRGDRGARLGWSCEPHRGPGELRELGMPLARIKWQPTTQWVFSANACTSTNSSAPKDHSQVFSPVTPPLGSNPQASGTRRGTKHDEMPC